MNDVKTTNKANITTNNELIDIVVNRYFCLFLLRSNSAATILTSNKNITITLTTNNATEESSILSNTSCPIKTGARDKNTLLAKSVFAIKSDFSIK